MSNEVLLIRDPRRLYRRRAGEHRAKGAVVLLRRPALVCVVLGVSVALGATGRVSVGLALSCATTWGFVPLLQLAAFAATTRIATRGGPPFSSAVDLFFMGHLPWSLWLIAVAGAAALTFPNGTTGWPAALLSAATCSVMLPMAATVRITHAYFREVAGLPANRAAGATVLYHTLVTGFGILYAGWAIQFGPRVLGS